jgi:hypothetical protein
MPSERLIDLNKSLVDLYEQLSGLEKAFDRARDEDKVPLNHRIRDKEYEIRIRTDKFLRQLSQEIDSLMLLVSEQEAEQVLGEIINEAEIVKLEGGYSDKLQQKLEELLTQMKKPAIPASGKLKAAIPILPGFIAYELEVDTEGLIRRIFPTFCRLLEKK